MGSVQRVKDRVALITGGTSGIGRATVELFVREGAMVAFTGRSDERGKAIETACGPQAVYIRADMSQEDDIERAILSTVDRFGRLDVLFNNAGGPTTGEVETVTRADFQQAMDLLLGSVVFGIRFAAPIMKAQGNGAIISNSSVAALRCHMGGYLYSAAKAAVTQVSKMAGMELGPHGVTVNTVSPGGIVTPIFFGGSQAADTFGADVMQARMRKLESGMVSATPMLRAGEPDDIANAVLFLATDDGRFVNCHDLVVDAGMTAGGRNHYVPHAGQGSPRS